MDKDLLIIVPTRNRPRNVVKVIEAWEKTNAFDDANVMFAFDDDDPLKADYMDAIAGTQAIGYLVDKWMPMVLKLNLVTNHVVSGSNTWVAVGFAGDDHLPRTIGWAHRYLEELADLGTGIVYGDDLYQGARFPTEWAMTIDIIQALGRMVPAPVHHLYCDNSIQDLGKGAQCIRHIPDVVIEHVHPIAHKTEWDEQYRMANSKTQYREDGQRYNEWKATQLKQDVEMIRGLKHD